MTVDIKFGRFERYTNELGESWDRVTWPGEPHEADGTRVEHTIFAGQPIRGYSYSGFGDWLRHVPQAEALIDATGWQHSDGTVVCRLTPELVALVNALPKRGRPVDKDRARWWQYWTRRAVEEFGADAAIYIW